MLSTEQIRQRVEELGEWFHNLDLGGVKTAPDHFLGDYPQIKWQQFSSAVPEDLTGKSVLDVGCNAGFYSIQMKRRGAARVVAIDTDEQYLEQARFAAKISEAEIEFRKLSVYRVGDLRERFDLVLFMGVLYHLRHPLLALELLHEHVVADLLVTQSLLRGARDNMDVPRDFPFWETEIFGRDEFPRMYFVEQRFANDPTNWWIPNRSCFEAMLRSAGFEILDHPEDEVFICRRTEVSGPLNYTRELREITR
ncbi:MAG TPA: TIGR04290 family methyltransferase [Pyrinomonadaceae bacterium]|nr:TIGR04290 family methyltransferase [Pyrinomonadaceae bacterium]